MVKMLFYRICWKMEFHMLILWLLVIGDSDHIGGLFYVLEKINVKNVVIGTQKESSENIEKLLEVVNRRKAKLVVVNNGDKITVEDNIWFDILWPNEKCMISENSLNNNSLVCKLNYRDFSVLFTGDIEEIAERKILNEYKDDSQALQSTVLKVAHHGSKTSSIREFIEAVNPQIALIGVGKNNIFGHPNQNVLERLKEKGVKIFRTDLSGEIILKKFLKSINIFLRTFK